MERGENGNRIENAILEWRKREERYNDLFGFNVASNKLILRDKLIYYDKIANKFSDSKNIEEQYALKLLSQERKNLEKRLYPNRIIRLLRRLLVRVIWTRVVNRRDEKNVRNQVQQLQGQLGRYGFPVDGDVLAKQIKADGSSFNIAIPSTYVKEHERMDYSLMFTKDETGNYRFDGYKALFQDDRTPEEKKSHVFRADSYNGYTAKEAHKLLSGCSMKKDGNWVKIDFNDKKANGEYVIKEYGGNYGFDLERVLSELPIKRSDELSLFRLKSDLERGFREAVTFLRDGIEQTFYIQADPQRKSVTIYDENSKKITLNSIKGEKCQNEVLKVVSKANEQKVATGKRTRSLKVN